MRTRDYAPGGYRYIEGVFQYSAGVRAMAGFEIVRVRFRDPMPLAEGFEHIERHLRVAGRARAALCACELRSPAQFSEAGFRAFNETYVGVLERWGIYREGLNPIARSNVCPEIAPPEAPAFHAFSYTRPGAGTMPSFVIAGSGEVPEGRANYRDHIVASGDTSSEGMQQKARWVIGEIERRLGALGLSWADTTDTQVYTAQDMPAALARELVSRGSSGSSGRGFTWHFDRPPITGLDFEMDCRGVGTELVYQ
jgi:hypothetical protein